MNVQLTLHHNGIQSLHEIEEGTNISPLLRTAGHLAQSCGSGKCGKCRIKANTIAKPEECALLGQDMIEAGFRLACYTEAQNGLEISTIEQAAITVITHFAEQAYEHAPLVEALAISPTSYGAPSLGDQRDDMQRILDAAKCTEHTLSFAQMIELSNVIHTNETLHILRQGTTLLGKANPLHHLAMAVDIGTTTIAAMLIDLKTNQILAVRGEANAQAPWGADVISRIQQTLPETTPDFQGNANAMQKTVLGQIDKLCTLLLQDAHMQAEAPDVHYITIAGNTTMMHLLCGLPAAHISRAPFIPITMGACRLHGHNFGLQSSAQVFLLPSISAYIGADIVAALLAANAHMPQKPFLLLDLGTNAEIALGYDGKFMACSAAAGPCFEGASLSCGMPGQSGAINTVYANDTTAGFAITTISNTPAKGLCGSGVLDTIAMLLESGNIDETGLLEAQDNAIGKAVHEADNGQAFFTLSEKIHLTQRDIREVQLAKAAVRAGIHTLLAEAQLSLDAIETLYIAGGFGSAMNPESAAKIGLIPKALVPCTKPLGNAAGLGVVRYATELDAQKHVENIVKNTQYLELSAMPSFTDIYVEQMIFDTDDI